MKDLFVNTQLPVVTSDRILYTPSNFARTSLLYLQEIGSLRVHKPHSTGRSNLSSYLFFTVTDGEGELICEGRTYSLRTGDCVFIDCRKQYAHSSSEKLWSLSWIHFYGPNMTAIYDKYLERGGRAVFHPVSVSGFLEICHRIYELADSDTGCLSIQNADRRCITVRTGWHFGYYCAWMAVARYPMMRELLIFIRETVCLCRRIQKSLRFTDRRSSLISEDKIQNSRVWGKTGR